MCIGKNHLAETVMTRLWVAMMTVIGLLRMKRMAQLVKTKQFELNHFKNICKYLLCKKSQVYPLVVSEMKVKVKMKNT